jgi:hypothetical protein
MTGNAKILLRLKKENKKHVRTLAGQLNSAVSI